MSRNVDSASEPSPLSRGRPGGGSSESNPPLTPPFIRAENHRVLLLLLILLTAGFRLINLEADPPSNFSWSGGYFADEGFWAHNARNAELFGKPVLDDWDSRVVSPLFTRLQSLIFHNFGVGLLQVRIIGVFSSILLAVCTFLLLRKQFDQQISFLGAVLVSLNYPMLILGRQGILDPFASALAWGALALVIGGSPVALFLGGTLAAGACITKYLMIYIFLPFVVLLTGSRRNLLVFAAGATAAFLVWYLGNYLPNRELLLGYSRYYSSQQSWEVWGVLKSIALQPFYLYFVKTPAILMFGNLMLWHLVLQYRKSGTVEKACWLWLLTGILFFSIWRYRPLRYYTSLLPPLCAMAGMVFLKTEELAASLRGGKSRLLLLVGILVPAAQMSFVLFDRLFSWNILPEQLGIQATDAVIFLLLSAAVPLILIRAREKARWMILAFALAFLGSDMRNYLSWIQKPEFAAAEISQDLQKRVGNGVLTGQWAPELCLENKVRTVPVWHGFVNSEQPFQHYGITHILLWEYTLGGEKFEEWYPQDFQKFRPVAKYKIKNSDLILYEKFED